MKHIFLTLFVLFSFVLTACGIGRNTSLEGTSWQLVAIGKHPPVDGSTITLTFEEGQVKGHSGCNSFGGDYKLKGDAIEFGMLMSTLMACADSAMMEQESTFMRMLGETQRVVLVDGQLQLYGLGQDALTFTPQ